MRYMHTPAGYEYYWLVIPVVGFFILLFNAYRMRKFRDSSVGIKMVAASSVLLVFVAGFFLLNQRVLDSYLVSADGLTAYPDLEEAFWEQEDAVAGDTIVVVEIGNLFRSREIYLMPCYWTEIRDVPRNGQTHWTATAWVICSESDAYDLSRISFRDLELNLDFGEETMISSRVELNHGQRIYDLGTLRKLVVQGEYPLSEIGQVHAGFLAGTSASASIENEEVSGAFIWSYDLYLDGKKIAEIRNDAVEGSYLVNAT